MWHPVISAPFDVELQLRNIDDEGEHIYDLPCRRTVTGWIDAKWLSPIGFKPTHWRLWQGRQTDQTTDVSHAAR